MRELEAKNAIERKQLMQALFDYLIETGIKAELKQEPAINSLGVSVLESVVHLKEQNLDRIRLVGIYSGGCGVPGDIMRFQYEIHTDKELTKEQIKDMNACTKLIKEDKIMNLFGGKVVGVKWDGQRLAEILNQDPSISDDLLKCVKSWSRLEFQIEAMSPEDIYITGPQFSNPGTIAELYRTGIKEEIECCLFGYKTMEKIAKHIKTVI